MVASPWSATLVRVRPRAACRGKVPSRTVVAMECAYSATRSRKPNPKVRHRLKRNDVNGLRRSALRCTATRGLSGSDRQIVVALSPPRSVSCRCPTPTRRPLKTAERSRSPPLGECELSTPLLSVTTVCYRESNRNAVSNGVRSLNRGRRFPFRCGSARLRAPVSTVTLRQAQGERSI